MRSLFTLALLPFLLLLCLAGRADEERLPKAYTLLTPDQKYVLVMLPHPPREYSPLNTNYPRSGLYRNDGSRTPLWTVDWFGQAFVSSDGHYLVQSGGGHRGDHFEGLAVAFYKDGKKLVRYRIKDLLAHTHHLPFTVSHYRWAKSITFDAEHSRLKVVTLSGEMNKNLPYPDIVLSYEAGPTYTFDITTGKIVNKE